MNEDTKANKNIVLDIIIALTIGTKNDNRLECEMNNKKYRLNSAKYLLGQAIRQYQLPQSHILVSEKALELWQRISIDDIRTKQYRDNILCENNNEIFVQMYTGNKIESTAEKLVKGINFPFNNVFHDEHVIPIRMIISQLLALDSFTYENVELILSQMYICKILKTEDRQIKQKSIRPSCLIDAINSCYIPVGINVVNWEEVKSNYLDLCNGNCTQCQRKIKQ